MIVTFDTPGDCASASRWYVIVSPGVAIVGAVFVIDMSLVGAALALVTRVAVEELLPGTGSDVALLTVAVLLNDVPPGVPAGMPTKM